MTTLTAPVLVSVSASAAGDAVCVQLLVAMLLILPEPELMLIVPALRVPPLPVIAELLETRVMVPAADEVPELIPSPPIDKPAAVEVKFTEVVPLTVPPVIEIVPGAFTATVVPLTDVLIETLPLVVVIDVAPAEIPPVAASIVTGPAAFKVSAPEILAPKESDAVEVLVMFAVPVTIAEQEKDGVDMLIGWAAEPKFPPVLSLTKPMDPAVSTTPADWATTLPAASPVCTDIVPEVLMLPAKVTEPALSPESIISTAVPVVLPPFITPSVTEFNG